MSRQSKTKSPLFEIRTSRIQGRGAVALRRIRKGQRIVEYTGEIVHQDTANERYTDEAMARHHTFLFQVDEHFVIDATSKGSDARFMNHSCDPNCEAVNEEGRIFIEAIQSIRAGDELTYDYSFEHEGRITKKLRELYKCECGTPNCRGTILIQVPEK